ncbi:MAG: cupin domain-containing protein [Bacteroidota bacterium]
MKKTEIISEGKNYSAVDLGNLDQLMDHSFLHPKLNVEVKGKVFTGEAVNATGSEVSFQILPPGAEISFLHKHRAHEELYVFLKGSGQFQVDGNVFNIKEGSVVRISPEGSRSWKNSSAEEPMIFMVIQTMAGSLDNYAVEDGYRVDGKIEWNDNK